MWNWHSKYMFQSSGRFYVRIHGLCKLTSFICFAPQATWNKYIKPEAPTGSHCMYAVMSNQHVCDFYTQVVKIVRVDRPSRNKTGLAWMWLCALMQFTVTHCLLKLAKCICQCSYCRICEWYVWWRTQCSRKLFGQQVSCHLINKAALMINLSSYCRKYFWNGMR